MSNRILVLGFAFLLFAPAVIFVASPGKPEFETAVMWAVGMSFLFGVFLLVLGLRLRP